MIVTFYHTPFYNVPVLFNKDVYKRQLIANARYMLMSCAMSQRISPDTSIIHRILMGFYLTDELFAIAIARPGYLNPYYTYGAVSIAGPCWAVGTALGAMAGNLLPGNITSALSVSLYGMFLAIIIPPSRKSKIIAGIVAVSFVASFAAAYIPLISSLSDGTKTIILTIVISVLAAVLFPVDTNKAVSYTHLIGPSPFIIMVSMSFSPFIITPIMAPALSNLPNAAVATGLVL